MRFVGRTEEGEPVVPEKSDELAQSRERYLRAMRQLAEDAGDEESFRLYDEKLKILKRLQNEFDVMTGGDA